MVNWVNLDKLESFKELKNTKKVVLKDVMAGESGAKRVRECKVDMAEGMIYNYAAKAVDKDVLTVLQKMADEAQLIEKYEELYNGAVINTGEKRLVLHQLCRGQLGKEDYADGVNTRDF